MAVSHPFAGKARSHKARPHKVPLPHWPVPTRATVLVVEEALEVGEQVVGVGERGAVTQVAVGAHQP